MRQKCYDDTILLKVNRYFVSELVKSFEGTSFGMEKLVVCFG
jgi:hypothetical protein